MRFCVRCGSKLEQGDLFCPNCGASVAQPAAPEMPTARQSAVQGYYKGMKARGGLMVWLWILFACSCINVAGMIGLLVETMNINMGANTTTLVVYLLSSLFAILGILRLIWGHRDGLFLICLSEAANIATLLMPGSFFTAYGIDTTVFYFVLIVVLAVVTLGVIWLLARKQWPFFK